MRHVPATTLALAATVLAPLAAAGQTGGRTVDPTVRWSHDTDG
ncbi:MAG: hypothetical protein PVI57_06640 [Gemmatimonadota bacterium]|jgi:hypothetical protein